MLIEYVHRGQDKSWFGEATKKMSWTPVRHFANEWTATHAAALYPNGTTEKESLVRDFGAGLNTHEVKLGHEISGAGDAEAFVRQYGVRDFVLCVGRLETRKNQLMLLKALEDSDITVVFAAGSFSYQPEYDWAVRNFRRRGKTLVLDQLSSEMLASAYRACRVHALPSWYELPGLVSLEAAHYGKNVVVTANGTSRDYFGEWAFYCDPGDWHSVLNAVSAAFYGPAKEGIDRYASRFTWEAAAEATLESYHSILGIAKEASPIETGRSHGDAVALAGHYDMEAGATEFQEVLERGEVAAKNRDLELAKDLLRKAERMNPHSLKALRALGAVFLAGSEPDVAKGYFERAIEIDQRDAKSLSGWGMCLAMLREYEEAYKLFVRALAIKPDELVPILQLMECSYALNRFDDLEQVLRGYVTSNPEENEMRFCLAGCLFKRGIYDEAERLNNEVLAKNPSHSGAPDLKRVLDEARAKTAAPAPTADGTSHDLTGLISRLVDKKRDELRATEATPATQAAPAFGGVDAVLCEIEEKRRTGKYEEARAQLGELMKKNLSNSQSTRVLLIEADLKAFGGEIAAARALYEEVLGNNPRSARAIAGLGALHAVEGDWNKGREFFEQALSVDPDSDLALAGLGLWHHCNGKMEDAWEHYRKALERNPENTRALLGVMELGYGLGRLPAVEEAISNYLDMHPGDLDFLYALAGCYFAQDRIGEARAEVEKILLFKPDHEKANELKGMIATKSPASRPVLRF